MIDWIVGMWFGFWGLWLTWPALCAIFFWGVWGELDDGHLVNAISTIAISVLFWNVFDIPAVTIPYFGWAIEAHWIYAVLFIPVGFIWSFRRYKIFVTKRVASVAGKSTDKDALRRELEIKNNLNRMITWVLSWPVGMVSRAFEDIIFTLKDIALTFCKGIYNRILEKALSILPEVEEDDTVTGSAVRNH